MTTSAGSSRRDTWLMLAVFIAAVAFQLTFFDRWLALLDEGYVLGIADDIRRGKVLYRDVRVDAPFPGAFQLLAWWFDVAGVSIRSSRWLVVACFATFATALVRLARNTLGRTETVAFALLLLAYRVFAFPHWHVFSYSLVAATLATLAAVLVASGLRNGSTPRLVGAGLIAGCAIAAKQDYGLGVTGALGLAIVLRSWLARRPRRVADMLRPAVAFGVGPVVVIGAVLAWFAAHGALGALYDQTVRFPFTVIGRATYADLPAPWPLFAQDAAMRSEIASYLPSIVATLWWNPCAGCFASDLVHGAVWQKTWLWDAGLKIVFWLPLVVLPLAAASWIHRAWREREHGMGPVTGERLVVLALAGGFLLGFNKPRDWVHLMMIYPPQLLLLAMLVHDGTRRLPRAVARSVRGALALGGAGLLVLALALVVDLRRMIDFPLTSPRARVYADRMNGRVIEDALSWVNANVPPDAPLLVLPTHPMLGFLAGREAPGGYHVVWPLQGPERDERILSALEKDHVDHALYSISQWGHIRFEDDARELFRALVARYEIDHVFSPALLGPIVLGLRRRHEDGDVTRLRSLAPHPEGGTWQTWPFDEVLTQPIRTDVRGPSLRIAVTVPPSRPVLRLAYGISPNHWFGGPTGPIRFGLEVASDVAPAHTVLEAALDPRERLSDRGWRTADIDLGDLAGRDVVLTFTVTSDAALPIGFAGWRDPAFVGRADPGPRTTSAGR